MAELAVPLVVVVAYGDPDHLRCCLAGLKAPAGAVTVVDNGRSDAVAVLSRDHGAVYVRPVGNVGFAAGVNLGCRDRGDRDVLLLNPDAVLTWSDVLRMHSELRRAPRCAAVSPRLARPDGSAEPPSWPIPSPTSVWADALGLGRLNRGKRFLTGAVLLLRGAALDEVGGFDERYFLYAEESDWQLRALRAGWTVSVVEQVTAEHLGGATSSDPATRSAHFHRSARMFALKWYGPWGAGLMRVGSLVAALRRSVTGGRDSRVQARATARTYLRRAT